MDDLDPGAINGSMWAGPFLSTGLDIRVSN